MYTYLNVYVYYTYHNLRVFYNTFLASYREHRSKEELKKYYRSVKSAGGGKMHVQNELRTPL